LRKVLVEELVHGVLEKLLHHFSLCPQRLQGRSGERERVSVCVRERVSEREVQGEREKEREGEREREREAAPRRRS